VLRVDPSGKWLLGADAFAGEAYVFAIGSGGVSDLHQLFGRHADATVRRPILKITPTATMSSSPTAPLESTR